MEKRDKQVIKKMYVTLTKELDATDLLSYLFQEDVIDEEYMEKIKAKKTRKKKNEKLIKILFRKENGLHMLIKALYFRKHQDYLAKALLENVSWSEEEKRCFEDQLHGKITDKQVLELQVANLRHRLSIVEQENQELKLKLAEIENIENLAEVTPGTSKHSEPSSRKTGKMLRNLFRKQTKSDDTATHEDSGSELFSELDFTLIVQIAKLLTSHYSWLKLGEAFKMDPHTLRAMELNIPSARAEVVLEFIIGVYPTLTVYDFSDANKNLGYSKIVELLNLD